ncbi:response regulator transcription factor [Massilia sp. TS11]|uniref:response regulator n=1 Tax=Massilia sp. TS11 TaxID=2908003 RepID=UPI001EDAF96F|nr:response regulator transcription factor [Massilia sp. TS11]MCG2584997.1 response regulator transcription factor [Massilia sp. TS11]
MIEVTLVDDQQLVRSGISGLLALTPDIRVQAEAGDGVAALASIAAAPPAVLLLDVRMPGMDGLAVLEALGARGDLPPTILLTTFDDDAVLFAGMRAGARGFLLKDISLERLAEAIRAVAAGGTVFRPVLTERLLAAVARHPTGFDASPLPDPLSAREIEILHLMAAGLNNREIGATLGPSEGTIKNHVSNILSKLGVRDRVRAVLRAMELGYV